MNLYLKKNLQLSFLLFYCILFSFSCGGQRKIKLDEYEFYIASKFKVETEDFGENVQLTLNDPDGSSLIIQNKLNILKTTLFKNLNDTETLKSMHTLKFDSYIEVLKGYEASEVTLDKIGELNYTSQTFKFVEYGLELAYEVRIVQLRSDYYAFYCVNKARHMDENLEVVNGVLESLAKENF